MEALEFLFNLQIEQLSDLFQTLKNNEHLQFSIFGNSFNSQPCGKLLVCKKNLPIKSFEFQKSIKNKELPETGIKRASDKSNKKQIAVKSVKKENSVPLKPADLVSVSGTEFKRNPDDFIGTMQSLDTGSKVFSCQFCGLQGAQKANVRRHVVLKHIPEAKEELKCTICSREFNLKQHLKAHYMQAHSLSDGLAKAAMNGL